MKARAPFVFHRRAGFTLIELIMALAGGAVILAAVYGTFFKAIKMRDSAVERTRTTSIEGRAATILRDDLRAGFVSGGTLAATLEASTSGKEGHAGYLKLTTTSAQDDLDTDVPAADVEQIEYYVVDDIAGTDKRSGMLVRAVTKDLLAQPVPTPVEETILHNVDSIDVAFYDGTTWKTTWTVANDSIPQGVRVRIMRPAPAGGRAPAYTEVLVPWLVQTSITPAATPASSEL